MGLEDLVSKRRGRPYQAGRSKHWVKIKNRKHPAMSRLTESFDLLAVDGEDIRLEPLVARKDQIGPLTQIPNGF